MKKLVVMLVGLMPALVWGQVKPNVNKAEQAWRAGKLDEAKAIIDATTTSQEYLVDKKGQPTKNAAKSWYLKGIIYCAIDTTKNEKWKSLEADPWPIAKEAFEKCQEIDKGKTASFLTEPGSFLPILTTSASANLANAYYNKAATEYQDKKDYKKAYEYVKAVSYLVPEDTAVLLNVGVYFAPAAGANQEAIEYINKYIAKGGKSTEAYIQMFAIYRDKLKDFDKALATAQDAVKKFPNNPDFPKYELDMYIKMNRLPDAKVAMEKQVKANPADKESRYFLGVINSELNDHDAARKCYEEAINVDPKYYEPRYALAELVYLDAKKVKAEMNQLGITAEDKKKRFELDKVYVDKLKIALPYWEQCEKMNPDDAKVLDTLLGMYTDLDNQAQVNRVSKHMKALGLLD
ncbi:MAG: tetratricopeptide repeat protein [Bacteroidetes bacterium]|nr:tetratricopeptide repeat protein [Bacteroidota bacterium]